MHKQRPSCQTVRASSEHLVNSLFACSRTTTDIFIQQKSFIVMNLDGDQQHVIKADKDRSTRL